MENLDVEKFINDTRVSEVRLDECFQEQSSLRAYYGAQAASYEAHASKMKSVFEFREAQLFKEYRDKFAEEGTKTTEKMIENAVKLDPRWLKARQMLIDAQCQSDVAKAFVSSLVDRRDMLIQLGADRRDDNKGQMRLLAIQQENERLRELRNTASNIRR